MESDQEDIREIEKLFSELSAEVDLVAKASPKESGIGKRYADPTTLSAVERRILIRSVFSFIEAIMYRVKIGPLLWDTRNLSPGEIALINEEDYELDESGAVKTRRARLKFVNNFRFAFAIAAKASGIDFHIDCGGKGWQALRNAIPVRDRLMHPKRIADLNVSDEEVRNAMTAFLWVVDQMTHLAAETLLQSDSLAETNTETSHANQNS
jgi:hypothetical protein